MILSLKPPFLSPLHQALQLHGLSYKTSKPPTGGTGGRGALTNQQEEQWSIWEINMKYIVGHDWMSVYIYIYTIHITSVGSWG